MPSVKSILAGVSAASLALMPVMASANDSAAASLALSNAAASNASGTYAEQHKKRDRSFLYVLLGLGAAGQRWWQSQGSPGKPVNKGYLLEKGGGFLTPLFWSVRK